jgi:hypothetical protein
MRRSLWLVPFGLVLGMLAGVGKVVSQQGTTHAPGNPPGALPPGLEPATPVAGSQPPPLFPLTPEAGTWLILAAHYAGPDAPSLARQVALELRNTHHLSSYILNYADRERQAMQEEFERRQRLNPNVPMRRRRINIQESCGVLIGGFKDFEHATAYLPTVKKLDPPKLKLAGGLGSSPYDRVLHPEYDPQQKKMVLKSSLVNPFSNAMVVRNVTVPQAPKEVKFDPIWTKLNAHEEYSLLKNPKPWTLVVKAYGSASTNFGQVLPQGKAGGFLSSVGLGDGDQSVDRLGAAAAQAHALAEFLRKPHLGFDAYVFHMRQCSLVTVGGFASEKDPEMARVQLRLSKLHFSSGGGACQDPIGLMPYPIPIKLPAP